MQKDRALFYHHTETTEVTTYKVTRVLVWTLGERPRKHQVDGMTGTAAMQRTGHSR